MNDGLLGFEFEKFWFYAFVVFFWCGFGVLSGMLEKVMRVYGRGDNVR